MKANKKDNTVDQNDILHIHHRIVKILKDEKEKIPQYQSSIVAILNDLVNSKQPYGAPGISSELLQTYATTNIKEKQPITLKHYNQKYNEVLELHKKCIDNGFQESYYTLSSQPIINRYKEIISQPVKSSFMAHSSQKTESSEIDDIKYEYRKLLETIWTDSNFIADLFPSKQSSSTVAYDSADKPADTSSEVPDEDNYGTVTTMIFDDLSRINFNQKYKYEKKCHFKDIIMQYQGLQNKTIPKKVYDDIYDMIDKHNLDKNKITKEHLKGFLIESKHSNFYEDLQLIYHNITGKPLPDIQKYEKKLYEDFDLLVDAFLQLDKIDKINRKNFLNGHYVLRQLLRRHSYKVPEGDLNNLKTLSRMREHDDIFQRCCDLLSWSFTPMC